MITSFQNKEIKNLLKLKKSRERTKSGLILIEGRHEISLAIKAGLKFLKLFRSSDFNSDNNFRINEKVFEDVYTLNEELFKKISNRENPDGYLAIAKKPKNELGSLKLGENPLVVIMEGLEKPGNIGAIIRSADAVKVDAIIIADEKTEIYNPNAIRASLGAIFTNQLALASTEELINWLKINNFSSFALTPHTKQLYTDQDYTGPTALIVGTEHEGISAELLSAVEHQIRIEMRGEIDSLNASVSTAVVLFEVDRQRHLKK